MSDKSINVPEGKDVKFVDPSKEEKPFFHLIGSGKERTGSQTKPVDFIQELINMSKPEQFVIFMIKDKVGYNDDIGEAYISTSMFDSTELQNWKKGIKELKKKKLVGSRKTSHFMINPNAFIPQKYQEAMRVWRKMYPPSIADNFKL